MRWCCLGLASLLASLLACDANVGDACRAHADCDDELYCKGPSEPQVCGIPPREGCADDSECGGERCHAIFDPCSPDGQGSECGPPCAGALGCGNGFHCEAGACVASPCTQAGAPPCRPWEACDPGRIPAGAPVHARTNGCFAIACTNDDPCGDFTCVNGTCQEVAGTCREVEIVP